ncbi:unnamed protein product [Candidula unifasciata]|uniref:Alpha/beta hydrolase fold-3 domain-containing protein n=1 Tax=Candidula unifasciata TaxID=100452 RepID=A0A8S3YJ59_9EUPU|nr:unnamed protein product [Candidula unifasciata]
MAGPWDAFSSKYKVHQESHDCLAHLIKHGARPFSTYQITEAREAFHNICLTAAGTVNFDGQTQELKIPSPYSKDGIAASVYKPNKLAATPAILIYFHGGGLCMFERKYFESSLQLLAQEAGCIIVNSDYRWLPDNKGYAPFDDGVVVTKWVLENKKSVGGQPGSKVGVGGDSSGGQIAISVTYDVQGLDFLEFKSIPVLPHPDLQYFTKLVEQAIPNQATDPRVCPLARTNLKNLPPTLVLVAQLDPERDGGLEFAEKAKAAGANVTSYVIEGVPHIFFGMDGIYKTKCAEARSYMVPFIKQFQKAT